MFGLGFWEIAVLLTAALVIFGPSKLPELARTLGKGLREFRNATDEFKNTIDAELREHPPTPPTRVPTEPEKLPETVARSPSTPSEVDATTTPEKAPAPVTAAATSEQGAKETPVEPKV